MDLAFVAIYVLDDLFEVSMFDWYKCTVYVCFVDSSSQGLFPASLHPSVTECGDDTMFAFDQ